MPSNALRQALGLLDAPLLAAAAREQMPDDGVLQLIRIAAGDQRAIAAASISQTDDRVREAAILYLQQMLFAPNADHYRVLGVSRDAPAHLLKAHVHALMKWLHPDRTGNGWDSAFAARVLGAWDALKTPERRARYDCLLARPPVAHPRARRRLVRGARAIPWVALEGVRPRARRRRLVRIAATAIAVAMATGALLAPEPPRASKPPADQPALPDLATAAPAPFGPTVAE